MRRPARLCFAALVLATTAASAVEIPYGHNDAAGRRQNVGGASIYYEVYGDGKKPPLVLLHRGLTGSIADFGPQIPKLAEHFTVYAIATRGHGRSSVGEMKYTYQLFADDAAAILRRVTVDVAAVIGFDDGAIAAMALAGEHPHLVSKVVLIGGGRSAEGLTERRKEYVAKLTSERFALESPDFFRQHRAFMAEPERWPESVDKLARLYRAQIFVSTTTVESIVAPTLIIGGDRDEFFRPAHFKELNRLIEHSTLSIIPDCGHVESVQRETVWNDLILPFLLK